MRPIGELLKRVRHPVEVEKDTTNREIGTRSQRKGSLTVQKDIETLEGELATVEKELNGYLGELGLDR